MPGKNAIRSRCISTPNPQCDLSALSGLEFAVLNDICFLSALGASSRAVQTIQLANIGNYTCSDENGRASSTSAQVS